MDRAKDLLQLQAVQKIFDSGGFFQPIRKVHAVKNVTMTVRQGECLGIVGESGSGKSTLGRIILGVERPDSGQVLFQGADIYVPGAFYRDEVRKNLQVVFQDCFSSMNPRLTVAESICEPLRNFCRYTPAQLGEKVEQLLEMVGIASGDRDKYPRQFSGGQLQRVCIARAIALQPKLIVLDEAVSSLDMLMQAQVLELLTGLQRELGMAYVFISHDLAAVAQMADRIAVMDQGEIVEEIVPSVTGLDQARHPASRRLAAAVLPVGWDGCRPGDTVKEWA